MSPIIGARGGLSASAYGLFAPSAAAGAYESIQTVSLGSAQSSASFTSIPSTYKHLQIRGIVKMSSGATNLGIRFNSDSGSNYSWHQMYSSGSGTPGAAAYTGTSYIGNNFIGSSQFSGFVIDILNYEDTNKYKQLRSLGGADENGGGYIVLSSGSWRNTAAINNIYLYDPFSTTTNFTANSHFALYGIKG